MSVFKATGGLLLSISLSVLVGCGPNDGLTAISGEVLLDGKPLEKGSISLQPVDGKGVSAGGDISNGRFTARTSPGNLAVQINSMVDVEKKNPTKEEIERGLHIDKKEIIPAEYNRASKLRIEVTPEKKTFNFSLSSDGKEPGI